MKTFITLLLGLGIFLSPKVNVAQTSDYKVVFDLTSKDSSTHQMVIRWLKGISKSDPKARLEVVFYGKSLEMITKDRSVAASDVTELAKNPNISFQVCEVAMDVHKIPKDRLLPGVLTVPDGIRQIAQRQKEGWAYIKVTQ